MNFAPPPAHGSLVLASDIGRIYETAMKRGMLRCLIERGMIAPESPQLEPWLDLLPAHDLARLVADLGAVDPETQEVLRSCLEHTAQGAFLTGYSILRDYLASQPAGLALRALYAPCTPLGFDLTPKARTEDLCEAFGLVRPQTDSDHLAYTGNPANADFALLFDDQACCAHLLIAEISNSAPSRINFTLEESQLVEIERRQAQIDSRSVFTRIAAEVSGEHFELATDLADHLPAFSGSDRPLAKLAQACAYAHSFAQLLGGAGHIPRGLTVRALSVTSTGIDSLAARYDAAGEVEHGDARGALMNAMRHAYIRAANGKAADVGAVFAQIASRLPPALSAAVTPLTITPGQPFSFTAREELQDFFNPARKLDDHEIASFLKPDPAVTAFFGAPPATAVTPHIAPARTLRDLHAAAIVSGLKVAKPGHLTALALEGNPGIGKTTAVRNFLRSRDDGFLFLYFSPRVGINNEVYAELAGSKDAPSGVMTLTSTSELISTASSFARKHPERFGISFTDRAVRIDGAPGLADLKRKGSMIFTHLDDIDDIDAITRKRDRKQTVSGTEDQIVRPRSPGVLSTICHATRIALEHDPTINQVAITAAIQTMRQTADGQNSTNALQRIFDRPAQHPSGRRERQEFAKRFPLIIAMVDELAGDGAGAPFVHALASWMRTQFLDPFDGQSPYTCILIPADASLATDRILDQYLRSEDKAPDKVLIAPSHGAEAFALTANTIQLAGLETPCLNVMTNSFPAARLTITTTLAFRIVDLVDPRTSEPLPARSAIAKQTQEADQANAVAEIFAAAADGAAQTIYFAQDRMLLADMKKALVTDDRAAEAGFSESTVQILDSSVALRDENALMVPERRDQVRVFLMTSSGSRGLSFPKCTAIIASMPRFKPEAALMELSQLVYRGRGRMRDGVSFDQDGHRKLTFLVSDAITQKPGEPIPADQWLRHAADFLTLAVMLRSTLLTRITGDSGLANKIAFVPVGAIGIEEQADTMTDTIGVFFKEIEIAISRSTGEDNGVLVACRDGVRQLLTASELIGAVPKGREKLSFTHEDYRRRLANAALHVPLRGLHLSHDPANPLLPPTTTVAGPIVYECWPDAAVSEAYRIDGGNAATLSRLKGQLWSISKREGLNKNLRNASATLHDYLNREKDEGSFRFKKTLDSRDLTLTIPLGYDRIVNADGRPGTVELRSPDAWRDALIRALATGNMPMPAVPLYRSFPFAAAIAKTDPLRTSTAFDDRYFFASSELNLLNLVLR